MSEEWKKNDFLLALNSNTLNMKFFLFFPIGNLFTNFVIQSIQFEAETAFFRFNYAKSSIELDCRELSVIDQ